MFQRESNASSDAEVCAEAVSRIVVLSPEDADNLDFLVGECGRFWSRKPTRQNVVSSILYNLAFDIADQITYAPKGGE